MPLTPDFSPALDLARALDAADPLASFRDSFHLPRRPDGRLAVYLCGHSLGLQPRRARELVLGELDAWACHGVEGHFRGETPWYGYHELVREPIARLVGGRPSEVVAMNGLTINLHLLLATFFRPLETGRRFLLLDEPTFPSDRYAVLSHLRHRGLGPDCLRTVGPRPGEHLLRTEDVEAAIGPAVGVVLLAGVNFLTGQWLDVPRLAAAARRAGCVFGLDLAHGVGNVPLALHDWDVDFAVWCSYKYLNAGPGAVAGCFVHERHGNADLPRLAGWWGNDPATRFRMQLEPAFLPRPGADGWQVSNPPILALAPLRASLESFDGATMPALREKSERLTGYLIDLLDALPPGRCEVLTPREPQQRGCQVSLRVARARETLGALEAAGVMCDFREPDVIRAAPVPLYNGYEEVWTFARALTVG